MHRLGLGLSKGASPMVAGMVQFFPERAEAMNKAAEHIDCLLMRIGKGDLPAASRGNGHESDSCEPRYAGKEANPEAGQARAILINPHVISGMGGGEDGGAFDLEP